MQGADTRLLVEGKLCDGRMTWVLYSYVPSETVTVPVPMNQYPKCYGSVEALMSSEGEFRGLAVVNCPDGALGYWDVRVLDGRNNRHA